MLRRSIAVALVAVVLGLGLVVAIGCGSSDPEAGDPERFTALINSADATYEVFNTPEEMAAMDAVVVGTLGGAVGMLRPGPAAPVQDDIDYLAIEVEVNRVLAWNLDTPVLVILVRYPPRVSEEEIAESLPIGQEVLLAMEDLERSGWLAGQDIAPLDEGRLFGPHTAGFWFRGDDGAFTGLIATRAELEAQWDFVDGFDGLLTAVDSAASRQ